MMIRIFTLVIACVVAGSSASLLAGTESGGLDLELFDGLRANPLDEFDRELFAPKPEPDPMQPGRPTEPVPPKRLEAGDPLTPIARRMQAAAERIGQAESDGQTQGMQQSIVEDIQRLLEQAKSQCQGGACSACQSQGSCSAHPSPQSQPKKPGSASSKASNKPAADSNAEPGEGTAQRPSLDQIRELQKAIWGNLPEKERQQMLQLLIEDFLPEYESLIEAYFRRLSEMEER